MAELETLLAHYIAAEGLVEAAKVARAMSMVSTKGEVDRLKHGKVALGLLEQAGSRTTAAQQVELEMRGNLLLMMRTGSADKNQNTARMQVLMAGNSSLRLDPLSRYYSSTYPKACALVCGYPKIWDAGKVATQETVQEVFRLQFHEGASLFSKAAKESVGARKECIDVMYVLCCTTQYTGLCSTDETAEMIQQHFDAKWGKDGSIGTAAVMNYRFQRHFAIAQGIGCRFDLVMCGSPYVPAVAEHCGDVQQMVQLFEKQLGAVREFYKSGAPGSECSMYCGWGSFPGLELNALHPFGKEFMALLGACGVECTDPSDVEGWFGSADWGAHRAKYGEGLSSKDGLHHMLLKPTIISAVQARLSLSLASMGRSNFDVSWLDHLPSADDPKLHDGALCIASHENARVSIAEVREVQRRHREAIRCA
jgi:hypothetical protein